MRFGGTSTFFTIRPLIIDGLTMPCNISGPFMAHHQLDQLHSQGALRVQGKLVPLVKPDSRRVLATLHQTERDTSSAYVTKATVVPAGHARFLPLTVSAVANGQMPAGDGVFEPQAHFIEKTDLHPAMAACSRLTPGGHGYTSVMNTTDKDIIVPRGLRFGEYRPMKDGPDDPRHWRVAALAAGSNTLDPPASNKARSTQWYKEQFQLTTAAALQDPHKMNQAIRLLQEYEDLFPLGDQYGRTNLVEHEIHTQDVPPIKCRNRPINPLLEKKLKEQLDHWLEQDVIEPSTSPWSFALLAVPKKNGKIRWCVDYRRLNEITLKDSFPLPNIEDNLARLANSKVFSGIDGTGAYHVVSIRRQDREKTAFSTPWGLFQFKQMPFGLCNAPATYCRLVQKVLAGIPLSVAIPYLNDTCIHSVDVTTHIEGLRRVLLAHRRAGLTLQPKKCQLFQDRIEYLGHNVSAAGISVPDRYTKIIEVWPEPQTLRDVRTFLGKVSYYRRFIPGFSGEASALTDLTKKEDESKEFVVTAAALAAFHKLKNLLSSSHILAYPQFDSEQPFIVDTDWSGDPGAIGGVLSQQQDGEERVIAYGARKLNDAEKNYSSHKGELLLPFFSSASGSITSATGRSSSARTTRPSNGSTTSRNPKA